MSWHHLKDSQPRARKAYQCYLCERRIRKGARHVCRTGIDTEFGGYVTMRMHAVCEAATREWADSRWECYYGAGADFREYELGIK